MPRRFVPLAVLLAAAPGALAQRVVVNADSLGVLVRHADTLDLAQPPPYRLRSFVRPGSERVRANGRDLPPSAYTLDARRGLLTLGVGAPFPLVQLVVSYDTWGVGTDSVATLVATRRRTREDQGFVLRDPSEVVATVPNDAETVGTLRRSGSITRGVIAGSNRDVTLESGLKLSVEGEVAPGVKVEASLTDAQTPLVVEGTTRRLSEFDRLYLTVTTKGTQTRLGDVDLAFTGSDLVRISRRVQGGAFDLSLGRMLGGAVTGGRLSFVGSVPRGQFRQQTIPVLDGVQGPYRLDGAAGEPFILVVPGSEVVYLDGQRLERGFDGDYTIEYSTGEVTFTPRRLLRAEQRLTVEFQYTANLFPRSLTGGRAAFDLRLGGMPMTVATTVLREADGLTLGEGLDFTPEDSLLLRTVGGGRTYRSGATQLLAYDPTAPFVQYRLDRTATDSVFVALDAAPGPSEAVYRVRFTRVGTGQGRYVRDAARAASGIAYRFVGAGQGDYEPTRLLPKPVSKLLTGLDVRLRPMRHVDLRMELARSGVDENRFSDLGRTDGAAYLVDLRLDTLGSARRGLSGQMVSRRRQQGFQTFDRIRPVDFDQRWNVAAPGELGATGLTADTLAESLDELTVRGWAGAGWRGAVEAGRLALGDAFGALRAAGELRREASEGGRGYYRLDVAQSEDRRLLDAVIAQQNAGTRGGTLVRGQGTAERTFGRWTPTFAVQHETRDQRLGDSLLATSYGFAEVRPGVRYAATDALSFTLDGIARRSYAPSESALVHAFDGLGVQGAYQLQRGNTLNASGRVEVRKRIGSGLLADAGAGVEVPDAVAMQHDVRWSPLRGATEVSVGYLAQTERTPKLQEVYIRITPDLPEARYVWTDRNVNGARDLDEFLLETTPYEGTYARTLLPTDTLVNVAGVQARLRLVLDPARYWRTDSLRGWRSMLRRVSSRTTVDVDDRNRDADVWRIYALDPSRLVRAATSMNGRLRLAQDVTINRGGRATLDLGVARVRSLSNLSSGAEERAITTLRADGRFRIARPLSLRLLLLRDDNTATSDRFASRRYHILSSGAEASATWTPRVGVQLGGGVAYADKSDREAARSATVWRVPLEARLALGARLSATANVEAASVSLQGAADGEAAYELTEGRGVGTSVLWSAGVNAALSRMLTLTASYDGRAPQDAPLVQTLRVQLSATF